MKKALLVCVVLGLGGLGSCICLARCNYYVVEKIDIKEPNAAGETDDPLTNPEFDETLVDSRPLDGWLVNQSAAVIALDCPGINPDAAPNMLQLWPSHAAILSTIGDTTRGSFRNRPILPSANLLDAAAKQFDDGLYATLDLACYRGELDGNVPGAVALVHEIFNRLPADSPAKPFLAAALQLAGKNVDLDSATAIAQKIFLDEFEANTVRSKPISFYTWTPELEQVWKFFKFLQKEFWLFFDGTGLEIPLAVTAVLEADTNLMNQYRAIHRFYGRLTNPLICLPVDAMTGGKTNLRELAKQFGTRHAAVAMYPPSTSRENELFEQMFPAGVPENVELMTELIRKIRSGEVDLTPKDNDGWYQYQVHALECLLLPDNAQEKDKLLLKAKYKKRLVEAFKAMITKRRETHARQLGITDSIEAPVQATPPKSINPRLRIEPCATVYLRTARAYGFLQNFLKTAIPIERLDALHGLRKSGPRELALGAELNSICQRFYGFYLIACEDIGMRPSFLDGEPVEVEPAKAAALAWLDKMNNDVDLACDTRIAVPIYFDPNIGKVRLWAVLGVRLANLDASYARPPKIRRDQPDSQWQVPVDRLGVAKVLIAVDEFAEVEVKADKIPNREEFRALCDKYKTKEEIVKALEDL
ncbi:MAG TPA: hypothetical protein PLI09_19920 [Candidatus Hydrogenedentes bacterium]|nr:hypothetical protein [Candidatus Hydrogenedentota bacterium]